MGSEQDYHGHPNYNMIAIVLIVLMGLSVVADQIIANKMIAIVAIFSFSIVKAYLVIANFMHLKYEPALVDLFPYFSVACMILLFAGVYPDVTMIEQITADWFVNNDINFAALNLEN